MPLQRRARDNEVLENLVRHLGSLSIDLDDEEIELESTGPDISDRVGVSNVEVCSTIDLTEHDEVREIVKQLVAACHRVLLKGDDDYDPDRCDRCVKSDCCTIDRIHLTDEERARILDWLEIEDTPGNSERFFDEDDDLAGYYELMMKQVPKESGSKDTKCVFLKSVDGMMRCSIYEVRPNVCREYDAGYCTEHTKLLPRRNPITV